MGLLENTLLILALIATSAFFSVSEISLAAARRLKLEQMRDDGEARAAQVLDLQGQPGQFFTAVQIGLNAVAILAGVLGEGAYAPAFSAALAHVAGEETAGLLGSVGSFLLVTALFVLIADLLPKRIAMAAPEAIALRVVGPMRACVNLLKPFVWGFDGLADRLIALLRLPAARQDEVTPEDIVALANAGARAGVLARQEQQIIENVFELEARTAPSTMTARDSIVWFDRMDSEDSIRAKIRAHPHAKYPVCSGGIDRVAGYVDSKDILGRLLDGQPISLRDESLLRNALVLPDTLTLAEIIEQLKSAREDFCLIINEYALVVGLITLNDLTSTLMGSPVGPPTEEQIVRRDADSWLVDGTTPIGDVERALGVAAFPDDDRYETIAGFLMYVLRKVPRRTDSVVHDGCKFEAVDIDNHRIDQVLVTRVGKSS
jgi:CBS domain containing-hemolysin-like protein